MRGPAGLNSRGVTAPIIPIVLESGAMNAVFLFAFVMVVVQNSPSLELVSNMVRPHLITLFLLGYTMTLTHPLRQSVPMTGLVFCTVIFRVGLRQRRDSERYSAESGSGGGPPSRIVFAPANAKTAAARGRTGAIAGPRATSVHITTKRNSAADAPDGTAPRGLGLYKSDVGVGSELEFIEMDSKVTDGHFAV